MNGKLIPLAVKVGDLVVLPDYGGAKINLKDGEFFVYRDTDVMGTLQKEWEQTSIANDCNSFLALYCMSKWKFLMCYKTVMINNPFSIKRFLIFISTIQCG